MRGGNERDRSHEQAGVDPDGLRGGVRVHGRGGGGTTVFPERPQQDRGGEMLTARSTIRSRTAHCVPDHIRFRTRFSWHGLFHSHEHELKQLQSARAQPRA